MSPIPFSLLITSALSTYKRFISDNHWLILRPPFFLLVALRKLCLYTYLWVQFFFNKFFNSWVFFFISLLHITFFPIMFQTFFFNLNLKRIIKTNTWNCLSRKKNLFVLLQLKTILKWKTPFIICSCVKKTHHIENVLIKNF